MVLDRFQLRWESHPEEKSLLQTSTRAEKWLKTKMTSAREGAASASSRERATTPLLTSIGEEEQMAHKNLRLFLFGILT